MVFSSLLFIFVFLPIALILFYLVPFLYGKRRWLSYVLLTLFSLVFYYWGSGQMVLLLLISILFNWLVARKITQLESTVKKKTLLIFGICINLSALFYFKYWVFLLNTLDSILGTSLTPSVHPYLPVGISFYTFMAISYLVEVFRSPQEKASFLEFGTYLSLFPHLIAGPIVRFSEISQDLRRDHFFSSTYFFNGIIRFVQGLGMKVLIADNLAPTVDKIFSLDQSTLTFGVAWLGAFAYTFQIYFDFAGYSAMAIGLALMFGFHFPENFNRPYISHSITEFWRRWHITLSRWLRDYIYIPLGGNRKGSIRTYINLFAVFFICGLWHGAAWTFVVWGMYQGVLLIVERISKNQLGYEASGIMGVTATFLLTMIGWVIFRSESFGQSLFFLKAMLPFDGGLDIANFTSHMGVYMDPLFVSVLGVAAFFSFFPFEKLTSNIQADGRVFLLGKSVATIMIMLLVSIYAIGNSFIPFIYFRF